jgi:transposase
MVFKEGFSIARAIKKLSLKLTTARFIIQKFKESGTFPMKQFKKNTRMLKDLPDDELLLPNMKVKL